MNIFFKHILDKTGYTTKFNLDEKVFTIHDSNIIFFKVCTIRISKDEESEYSGVYKEKHIYRKESRIFRTKEELLKSL